MSNQQEVIVEFRNDRKMAFAAQSFHYSTKEGTTPVIVLQTSDPVETVAILPLDMVRAVYKGDKYLPI